MKITKCDYCYHEIPGLPLIIIVYGSMEKYHFDSIGCLKYFTEAKLEEDF